jgi:hypothetical protein
MRTVLWGIAVVCAALLAFAPAAASGPPVTKLVGAGGAELWWGPTWFTVHAAGAGSGVEAAGRVTMASPVGSSLVDVRCARQVGERTLVGGIIAEDTNPAVVGQGALVVVEEGGPGAKDRVGVAFGPTALASCPLDVLDAITRYDTLTAGNFVVLSP